MKQLRIAAGAMFHIAAFTLIWSLAFFLTSYVYDARSKEAVWSGMLESGSQIAALHGSNETNIEVLLEQLAALTQHRLVLMDASGRKLLFGGEAAAAFADSIDPADAGLVHAGQTFKQFEHPNLFQPGLAVTGQPLVIGGHLYGLFIQADTPGLFHDYGKQLVTLGVDLLFLFIIALLTTPMRKKQMHALKMMIAAIRRIAKGDFNVTFQESTQKGPWSELSKSLNHMAVQLNQMEHMRQEFISNVSHEIQSPLTSISGFARALHDVRLSPEERERYLNIIETESKRLSKLSDNLLKLTSLESQHHPYEPKPYRLDKQLRRIVLACEPQWLEKSLEMDVALDEVTIVADEDMLSQVWVNLLNNGIKFTPERGTIGVRLERQAGMAVVRITDTGIGIAEEDAEHIFERFYKADKSRNRSGGSGSGLGLSIAKKIIELHRGTIRVQSKLGAGTDFTVTLPLLPVRKHDHNGAGLSGVESGRGKPLPATLDIAVIRNAPNGRKPFSPE